MDLLEQFVKLLKEFNEQLSNFEMSLCHDGMLIEIKNGNEVVNAPGSL